MFGIWESQPLTFPQYEEKRLVPKKSRRKSYAKSTLMSKAADR